MKGRQGGFDTLRTPGVLPAASQRQDRAAVSQDGLPIFRLFR